QLLSKELKRRASLLKSQGRAADADQYAHLSQQCNDVADKEYHRAWELKPKSPVVLSRVGEYFALSGHTADAEGAFRTLLTTDCAPEDRAAATRQLALLLAGTRSYAKLQEALVLVDPSASGSQDKPKIMTNADLQAKAIISSLLPGHESRVESIKLLEQLTEHGRGAPQTRALLAQVYQADGQWQPALKLLQSIIASEDAQTEEGKRSKALAIAAY